MRVQHKNNSNESLHAQERAFEYQQVEDEIDQEGIPLKEYPTSGSRARIEDEEELEINGDISIELRDHEDEHDERQTHTAGEHIEGRDIEDTEADMASWVGQPAIKGSTESMRMALLTLSLIGLQYVSLPLILPFLTS